MVNWVKSRMRQGLAPGLVAFLFDGDAEQAPEAALVAGIQSGPVGIPPAGAACGQDGLVQFHGVVLHQPFPLVHDGTAVDVEPAQDAKVGVEHMRRLIVERVLRCIGGGSTRGPAG